MHLSLCDQMAEFVNLCPLGQDRKNEALITKRSMAVWNDQLTSVIKMRSCLLFLVKHFFRQSDKPAPQVTKNCLFCIWIWFFGWRRVRLLKIYRNISRVKSCLSFNCWACLDLHRQTTETIEEANSSQNSFSHQTLGDVQLIRRAENFEVRK